MFAADSCLVVTSVRRFCGALCLPDRRRRALVWDALIYAQCAAATFSAIHFGDRLLAICYISHFHERKPTRQPSVAIHDDMNLHHLYSLDNFS